MTPRFKAGDLVRLREDLKHPPHVMKLLGQVWMLEGIPTGPFDTKYGLSFRWKIPGTLQYKGAPFAPIEAVLVRVDPPQEKGSWETCAWKPQVLQKEK